MHRHGWGHGWGRLGRHLGLGHHGLKHHMGRRHGRLFEHGDLRFVVLALIAEKPRYGYEVIKAIEEKAGGAYTPSPGVVYPTLTMLEELGYATLTPSEGAKKLYSITAEGQACLVENRAVVDALLARMSEAQNAWGDGAMPQILRALESLNLALKYRFARGPVSEQQAQTIAAAIDAAVKAAEQN